MSVSVLRWPYEELQFRIAKPGLVEVKAPWFNADITFEGEPAWLEDLKSYIADPLNPNSILGMSQFLEMLKQHPVSYVLPRQGTGFGEDDHSSSSDFKSVEQLINSAQLKVHPLSLKNWEWDIEGILERSAIDENSFDPLALLSVVRRLHLNRSALKNETGKLYKSVESLTDNESARKSLAVICKQNYEVTRLCKDSVQAGFKTAQTAIEELREFEQAEQGHDQILKRALDELGVEANKIATVSGVENIMKLLEFSGRSNFLAFCVALDFFERTQYADEDPLARILKLHQFPRAADAINIHKDINDGGHHDLVSQELLSFMKPVDRDFATEAVRLSDYLSNEMCSVSSQVLEELKTNRWIAV